MDNAASLLVVFELALVGPGSERCMTNQVEEHRQHDPADHEHEHGPACGHEAVRHDDHVDYLHDGHRHAVHEEHYDEHGG